MTHRNTTLDRRALVRALGDAVAKLDPRVMVRNPVMFVVWVGAVLTTGLAITGAEGRPGFAAAIAGWLWLTVLFGNVAEAVAEGRGKAQADALRASR
ncbi:MAG: potassium-transporting ATPase subunit B, partial [Gemmatimonadaceae bacterium]|nr:potassium-transporting ATPase subunit B [Gemmatimonadaceae bacterium]